MASIVKRKNKFAVVYTAEDERGVKRQKWETFSTLTEAKKRKIQVEFAETTGSLTYPSAKTVSELLKEYVDLYGTNKWSPSTFDANKGLIDNYINPNIGNMKLSDVTPRIMDHFYRNLQKVKSKQKPFGKSTSEFITPTTIKNIHKILRSAFNQAVKWELMQRNPVENCTLPKAEEKKREIWDAETVLRALELCDDPILSLAIHLAFSCSLRIGELLALTWDCVDISSESIERGKAYLYVNKELQRVSKASLEALEEKDIIYKFPAIMPNNTTALIIKPPKTRTSVRKIFLPKTVAEHLSDRKAEVEELKAVFGEEYEDYNLVICAKNGRPLEGQHINRALKALIKEHDLPDIVFHSLRHTSTTYKLKISGGDIKAVQGDTGHAQATMVTERYAHILDDDRRINAERFEQEFYSGREEHSANETMVSNPEILKLAGLLLESPKLMEFLKGMV